MECEKQGQEFSSYQAMQLQKRPYQRLIIPCNLTKLCDDLSNTYDPPTQDKLCQLTGYKPSFFQTFPKAGKFMYKQQRAFKQKLVSLCTSNKQLLSKLATILWLKIFKLIRSKGFLQLLKLISVQMFLNRLKKCH